jgi:DNA-directed RNA polymerase specialized sigma24 family protein
MKLLPDMRRCFVLRFFAGFGADEIANLRQLTVDDVNACTVAAIRHLVEEARK